ncbi:phosphomannomutase [Symbiopectobacterium purcellii]|uniref:phosphomannomutase n=1 Tax=Symbiopectobacterium purcellii TaxID=2871826 RepID=UPI003F8313D4
MEKFLCCDEVNNSGVKFGTSGARGLVLDFTPKVCAAFAAAFIDVIKDEFEFSSVAIGIDNRPSSYLMAQYCAAAVQQAGYEPIYYGTLPTPALAYTAFKKNIPCIMVTGSHIPFDRNGLKFYRPDGELNKTDEIKITKSRACFYPFSNLPLLTTDDGAKINYINRYLNFLTKSSLSGMRIGIYEHSSAGRDIYKTIFSSLGAEVISLGRSDDFVPIDTEAVSDEDKKKAIEWSNKYSLDAIFSTDGDGDRPLLADEHGQWVRGDILGLLASFFLGIDALAVPVSCNTAIERSNFFKNVIRTKIGSPYVIESIKDLLNNYSSVAGFEANGGFLLGSKVSYNNCAIEALPTRDAVLPVLVVLAAKKNKPIYQLTSDLPQRYTYSDRIVDFSFGCSKSILSNALENPDDFLKELEIYDLKTNAVDITDGVRIYTSKEVIIHLRPSGNAPEFRCYVESNKEGEAMGYVSFILSQIRKLYSN